MPFPKVKRVIYRHNPLDQVICQIRFPPILKIDAQIPSEFQDRVRKHFPSYSESLQWDVEVPAGAVSQSVVQLGQVPQSLVPVEMLQQVLKPSGIKNYEFTSEDG